MAINDAAAQYTGQANAAAAEYKNAWPDAPSAGVGQFGSAPFANAAAGLSATAGSSLDPQRAAMQVMMQKPSPAPLMNKPLEMPTPGALTGAVDALAATPAGTPVDPALPATSNFSRETPYVADVTDAGAVARQTARPDRLEIDSTLSPDEQYRRAWQNEANGYYGNQAAAVTQPEKPPTEAAPVASQDDYRLPVNMTRDQFMAERYKHWDSGERDPSLLPYNTYEDYVDGWYKSDASKLVNRGAKPATSKGA